MSQVTTGVFGVVAMSLVLGAAQFASGRDLPGSFQDRLQGLSGTPEAAVNRAAKADRAAVMGSAVQTRTISLRLDGLADTSIVVRIPVAKDVNHKDAGDKETGKEANNNSLPSLTKPGDRKAKMTLACEPVVSSLVEIARQLQPGRCVT
jgi:hypothetical protein